MIEGKAVTMEIDTGAEVSLLAEDTLKGHIEDVHSPEHTEAVGERLGKS